MKEGRAVILISRSIKKKGLQESTEEKILQHLLHTERGETTERRAEELIKIIEDKRNTEADILTKLQELEEAEASSSK